MRLMSNLRMQQDMETCFGFSLLFLLLLLSASEPFSENTEHDARPDMTTLRNKHGAPQINIITPGICLGIR